MPLPQFFGRYEVLERVGLGGSGTVYRARDPRLGRTVAIKVLSVPGDEIRGRFLQEMQLLGTMRHPNIVGIHDCGEQEDELFFVMEFVEGRTLAAAIAEQPAFTVDRTLDLIECLCAALDYAHKRGVIHRDVKPANLMLDQDGVLKVLDFGIARVEATAATITGTVVGTPSYMAPEQIAGRTIDERTDVFATGLVLYELLSGQQAFPRNNRSTWQVMHSIVHDDPAPLSTIVDGIDPELERIVNRAIAKDPTNRYTGVDALAADVRDVRARPRVRVDPVTDLPPTVLAGRVTETQGTAAGPKQRTAYVAAALGAAVLLTVGGAAWLAAKHRDQPLPDETPTQRGAVSQQQVTPTQTGSPVRPAAEPAVAAVRDVARPASRAEDNAAGAVIPPAGNAIAKAPPAAAVPTPKLRGGDAAAAAGPSRHERETTAAAPYDVALTLLPPSATTPNPERAARLLERACDANDPRGCVTLADLLAAGAIVTKDEPRAARLYARACDGRSGAGCQKLAVLYLTGRGVVRSVTTWASYLQRACDNGSAEGCNQLGVAYAKGTAVARDESEAAKLYARGCEASLGIACVNLGHAYRNGRGVPRDFARARIEYRRGCDAGYDWGCTNLAAMLAAGEGGDKDAVQAARLFIRSCDAGQPDGCRGAGLLYERGDGVDKDERRAAGLFQRACDAGLAAGCGSLGRMYLTGRGVTQNQRQGIALLQRACDGGGQPACAMLSDMYARGDGVPKDAARAAQLAARARQTPAGQTNEAPIPGPSAGAPRPAPEGLLRAGVDVPMPVRVKGAQPLYPTAARVAGVDGIVVLEVTLDASGRVTAIRTTRSIPLLDDAAESAVRQWEYAPTLVNGRAVPVVLTVQVAFKGQ